MKNKRFIFLSFIVLLIVLLALFSVFHHLILLKMGNYLTVSDKLEKADIIVALGGEKIRKKEAVKLLKDGYAPFILFTGFDVELEDYLCREVPKNRIIIPPKPSYTTHDEAIVTLRVMEEKNFNSAIIVTSPYHTRRASLSFNQVFEGSNKKFVVYSAGDSGFKMNSWWKSHLGRKVVLIEYLGILYYLVFH